MPRLTRRSFLISGAAAGVAVAGGLVEGGVLPGRARLHGVLGLTGEDGVAPDVPAGPVESGSFESAARRTTVGWTVIYPHGHQADARLPVALVLHGRGGDHSSAVNDLGLDRYLTAAVRDGTPPFALAAVDGGRDNYWHRRATGDDPQRMLTAELLPLLAKRGLRTDRSETTAGAYDGPEDFQAHQVFGRAADLEDVALRIDCGRDDPFADAVRDLRDEVSAEGGLQAGAHTGGYWRRMLPDQLRFLGRNLAG